MLKHKRVALVAVAIGFLLLVFFVKNKSSFENNAREEAGLVFGNTKVGEILSRDTDRDGIPDWEEGLWGTDPGNPSTFEGEPDGTYVARLKAQRAEDGGYDLGEDGRELTQTDMFARELFATVAALSQTGEVDAGAVEEISSSLVSRIQSPTVKKVFTSAELRVTADNSEQAIQNYGVATDKIFSKSRYPFSDRVGEILQRFLEESGDEPGADALASLDPIIKNLGEMVEEMTRVEVPSKIAPSHLQVTNALERVRENLGDIRNFDLDPILALGAVNQYLENLDSLELAIIDELKAILAILEGNQ